MKLNDFNKHVMLTYGRYDLEFKDGVGATLISTDGKKYIDFLSGLGVSNLGYHHPAVTKAAQSALTKPLHVSNLFKITDQAETASLIQKATFKGRTFFCNSGAEANEAAFKFALKYGKSISKDKIEILTAYQSFHGRTMAALALTGQEKYQAPFKPMPGKVKYFKFNDIKDVARLVNKKTAAIFIEVVQGEGGVNIADKKFIQALRKLTIKNRALLIIDEVQSGCGRTGKLFAFKNYGITPDAFTSAKAMAGGFPIGALTVTDKYKNVLIPGEHASTFGGNPFVTAVSKVVIKELSKKSLLTSVTQKGDLIKSIILSWKKEFSFIKEVRNFGMMIALEFNDDAPVAGDIAVGCLKEGLILNAIGNKIIRMLPPLVIKTDDIKKGLSILHKVIKETVND